MAEQRKNLGKRFFDFFSARGAALVAFLVLFYTLTFLVYYFYSPGPEERRQAELEKNTPSSYVLD